MNFGGVVFASPLSTTVLLLQPASTCTILPSSGKTVTEKEKIHKKNNAVYRGKSVQNTAFEELYRNDKSFICLPRQHFTFRLKSLNFQRLDRTDD